MAFTFITACSAASSNHNTTTTTPNVNTTGADLAVVFVTGLDNTTFAISAGSDSYTLLTLYTAGAAGVACRMGYCVNPTQGSGYNIVVTAGNCFPGISAAFFSGVNTSTPFDQENGVFSAAATTKQPGSITPGQNDELIVCGVQSAYNNAGIAIDGGFTIPTNGSTAINVGNGFGSAIAYLIQTSAAASNPTWSGTGSPAFDACAQASFKAAGGGGGSTWGPLLGGFNNRLVQL